MPENKINNIESKLIMKICILGSLTAKKIKGCMHNKAFFYLMHNQYFLREAINAIESNTFIPLDLNTLLNKISDDYNKTDVSSYITVCQNDKNENHYNEFCELFNQFSAVYYDVNPKFKLTKCAFDGIVDTMMQDSINNKPLKFWESTLEIILRNIDNSLGSQYFKEHRYVQRKQSIEKWTKTAAKVKKTINQLYR